MPNPCSPAFTSSSTRPWAFASFAFLCPCAVAISGRFNWVPVWMLKQTSKRGETEVEVVRTGCVFSCFDHWCLPSLPFNKKLARSRAGLAGDQGQDPPNCLLPQAFQNGRACHKVLAYAIAEILIHQRVDPCVLLKHDRGMKILPLASKGPTGSRVPRETFFPRVTFKPAERSPWNPCQHVSPLRVSNGLDFHCHIEPMTWGRLGSDGRGMLLP